MVVLSLHVCVWCVPVCVPSGKLLIVLWCNLSLQTHIQLSDCVPARPDDRLVKPFFILYFMYAVNLTTQLQLTYYQRVCVCVCVCVSDHYS